MWLIVDCLAASMPKSITATVADAVRAKLAELDLGEQDIADAFDSGQYLAQSERADFLAAGLTEPRLFSVA